MKRALVVAMMAVVGLVLLVLALPAPAQPATPSCPAFNAVPLVPYTKAQAPSVFGGDITGMNVAFSGGGIALWRYAADGSLYLNVIPPSSLTLREAITAAFDFGAALFATDRLAAFNAALAAHLTRDMNDPELVAVWCPLWPQIVGPVPPPPAPASKAGSLTWMSNTFVRHDWGDAPCQGLAATVGVVVKTCALSAGGTRVDYVYTWSATAPAVTGWATRAYGAVP